MCTKYSQHEIGINDVVETLKKDAQQTEAYHDTRSGWCNPVDGSGVSRPAEPTVRSC